MDVVEVSSQRRIQLIDVTRFVQEAIEGAGIAEGVCLVFVPHTTAAVTLNENADPDVGEDLVETLSKIAPPLAWRHVEGNSEAHFLSSLVGASVSVPITGGELALGRWQAIYLVELDGPRRREVWISCLGE